MAPSTPPVGTGTTTAAAGPAGAGGISDQDLGLVLCGNKADVWLVNIHQPHAGTPSLLPCHCPLRLQQMVRRQALPVQNEAQALIHRATFACWTYYPDTIAKHAGLFKHRSRHRRSYPTTLPMVCDLEVVDPRCLSSKKEREGSHRLSTQPGNVVTQGLISAQTKADVEPFSRFVPLVVLQVAMEGAPERHPLLVHDPLDGQIWRWRERGSDCRKIYCHPNPLTQALPSMR